MVTSFPIDFELPGPVRFRPIGILNFQLYLQKLHIFLADLKKKMQNTHKLSRTIADIVSIIQSILIFHDKLKINLGILLLLQVMHVYILIDIFLLIGNKGFTQK